MILNNYWKWLDATLKTYFHSESYYDPTTDIGMKNLSGEDAPISLASNSDETAWESRNFENGEMRFGSGTGSTTAEDYSVATDITDSLSNLSLSISSAGTNGLDRTFTATGANNSGSAITITQVGSAKTVKWYDNDTGYHTEKVLFCKTTLTTPITVEDGDSFLINLAWNEV